MKSCDRFFDWLSIIFIFLSRLVYPSVAATCKERNRDISCEKGVAVRAMCFFCSVNKNYVSTAIKTHVLMSVY